MSDLDREQWRMDRAGRITGSAFLSAIDAVMPEPGAVYKSGPRKGQPRLAESSAARNKLMRMLAFERTSGIPVHEIGGKALSWGTDLEPYSRGAFELETGLLVQQCALIVHPQYDFVGATPDGLIGTDAGLEMKNPMDEAVHMLTWEKGMPQDHIPQVQGGMWVTGRKKWFFVSYDARAAEKYRLYIQVIHRDDDYIHNVLAPGVLQFEAELVDYLARLERRRAEVSSLLLAA